MRIHLISCMILVIRDVLVVPVLLYSIFSKYVTIFPEVSSYRKHTRGIPTSTKKFSHLSLVVADIAFFSLKT